jgi:hypothetical protein
VAGDSCLTDVDMLERRHGVIVDWGATLDLRSTVVADGVPYSLLTA